MGRRKTVIPAAGQSVQVPLTGRAVIVESVPIFTGPESVPTLSFNDSGGEKPLYPQAVYNNAGEIFNRIVITGTEESQGAEVWLYSTMDCLEESFSPLTFQNRLTTPGQTVYLPSTNDPQHIDDLDIVNVQGELPQAAYMSASGEPLLYSFIEEPDQEIDGHILFPGNEPVKISGINWILALQFISQTAGQHGVLVVTPEF